MHLTGQFTLRDMYEQFQNIMKMGPFGQIMVNQSIVYYANIYCVYNVYILLSVPLVIPVLLFCYFTDLLILLRHFTGNKQPFVCCCAIRLKVSGVAQSWKVSL